MPINVLTAGVAALAINSTAFTIEIFRGGFAAVPVAQHDAARALGLRPALIMALVVVPQVFRIVLPPLGNQIVSVVLGSAQGELFGLQWPDVDLEGHRIHVRRSLWHGELGTPKSRRSQRAIDLPPTLEDALKCLSAQRRSEFVFCSRDGTPMDADNFPASGVPQGPTACGAASHPVSRPTPYVRESADRPRFASEIHPSAARACVDSDNARPLRARHAGDPSGGSAEAIVAR
jgi:hypothetical protein